MNLQRAALAALLFGVFAQAAPPKPEYYSSSSKYTQPSPAAGSPEQPNGPVDNKCYTTWGQTPPAQEPSTSWSTHYSSCTVTSTVTESITTTPEASTSVISATTTETSTAPTNILTATDTQVTTDTDTITTTTTNVETTTATTTTTTSVVIPVPAAFTPVQDSLPGSSYGGSGGSVPPAKRDLSARSLGLDLGLNLFGNPGFSPAQFKKGVHCEEWREPEGGCTVEIKTVTSTFAAATPTVLATSIGTETTVFVPSATTTITTTIGTLTTELVTATESTTLTQTETESVAGPTPTVYAACLANNFADTYSNGQGFDNLYANDAFNFDLESSDQDSAYDCCMHVFTSTSATAGFQNDAWAFGLPSSPAPGTCYVFTSPTCPVNEMTSVGSTWYVIGNGPCGFINSLA